MIRARWAQAVFVFAVLVAGCAQQSLGPASGVDPARNPDRALRQDYDRAAAQGRSVFRIDAEQSLVVITVRRGGSLARLGHDHVVASHAVQGWMAPDVGRADLWVPLADLSVDEPALRAEAGLDTQPSASDIVGTRANMQDKVLDVQQHPYALIHVASVDRTPPGVRLNLALTLRGVTRTFTVPALVQADAQTMEVGGGFEFNQSDFGIVPFSILGGAIQVQDRLSPRFRIRATRAPRASDRPD